MDVIRLPRRLADRVALEGLNQRLHGRSCHLDWSAVEEAPEEMLGILLGGLDLVEDGEWLGIETVPDALADAIEKAAARPERAKRRPAGQAGGARPELWKAPAGGVLEERQAERRSERAGEMQEERRRAEDGGASAPEERRPVLVGASGAELREMLHQLVLGDLLGPKEGPEEEVRERSVRDRYLVGMLAPRRQRTQPEPYEPLAAEESGPDEGEIEGAVQGASMFPSSFGLSCSVAGEATALRVVARWGRYRRQASEQDEEGCYRAT